MINIALYQPDIPQNTAAIIRTCACLDLRLEIIKPTGFILHERKLERIYLDYLEKCKIKYHNNFEDFLVKIGILNQLTFDTDEIGTTQIGKWGKCKLATVAFGHGIATTLLQLTKGYSICLLYTSPSPRDPKISRMPSSA